MEDADVQSEVSEHDGSRTPEEVADYAEERASSPTTPTEKSADIPAVPPESLAAVHFNAPAKEFWEKEFKDQEKTHEATGTPRGKTRYFGTCKKCGKIVSGTESFWCFRQHCQTKHFEAYAGIEPREEDGDRSRRSTKAIRSGSAGQIKSEEDEPLMVSQPVEVPEREPVDSLPSTCPSKEFFERLYNTHEAQKGKKRPNGRNVIRYTALCKLCDHKTTGMDSFYAFKEHYKHKHPENVEDMGEDAMAAAAIEGHISSEDGTNIGALSVVAGPLPFNKPSKDFYETLFDEHEMVKEEKPDGGRPATRYSANCKLCAKKVTGTDTFYGFRQHFRSKHRDLQVLSCTTDEISSVVPPIVVRNVTSDNGNDHPSASTGEGPEVISFQCPSKQFFEQMYHDQSYIKVPHTEEGKREKRKISAVCKICERTVTGVDSFHNFRQHFYSFHGSAAKNVKKMSRGSTNTGGGIPVKGLPLRAGGTLNWSSASTGSSSNVHPDQNKLDRNVALCAAESLIPLEQLTKPCFNRLIGDLDGHVSWPSYQALSTKHLPQLRSFLWETIVSGLKEAIAVAVTVYIWPQRGFFAVVGRYIDSSWTISSPVLAAKSVHGQQSTNAVFQSVLSIVLDYGIKNKVVYADAICGIDPDGDAGMDKFKADKGVVLNGGENPDQSLAEEVKDLMRKHYKLDSNGRMVDSVTRSLAVALNTAVKNYIDIYTVLKKILNLPSIVQKPAAATNTERANLYSPWHTMLQKAKAASEYNWDTTKLKVAARLNPEERIWLTEFIKINQYFEEVFQKLQRHEAPVICDVIPLLYGLRHSLTRYTEESEVLQEFVQNLLDELDSQFEGADEATPYLTAAFLDPSYKLLWCKGSPSLDKADQVTEEITNRITTIEIGEREIKLEPGLVEPPVKRSALLSFLGEPQASPAKILGDVMTPEAEVQSYLEAEVTHEDPLEFWRANCGRFKRLATLARSTFFFPVVSIHYQSLQDVLADKYMQDAEQNTETLIYCHCNLPFAADYCGRRKRAHPEAEYL